MVKSKLLLMHNIKTTQGNELTTKILVVLAQGVHVYAVCIGVSVEWGDLKAQEALVCLM